jgi:nucleoside-diphosphate-sugar epimerase
MTGRVLMTGATGFLGSIISSELIKQGYDILTIGKHESNTFMVDLVQPDFHISYQGKIDMIVHVAGKAHSVPRTKQQEQKFFDVNFEGTKNLCNAIMEAEIKPASFVFISTVAVYGQDKGEQIREDYPLLGKTPYARSKIMAEQWLTEWANINEIKLAILRLPLVAGPNPPGNLGAMIKGIGTGKYLSIGNADAKKSVVWAGDIAKIIPVAAQKGGIFNLADGYDPSFGELETGIAGILDVKKPRKISFAVAKILALGGDLLGRRAPVNSNKLRKITSTLTFDDSKARSELNWRPVAVLDKLPEMI